MSRFMADMHANASVSLHIFVVLKGLGVYATTIGQGQECV